MFFMDTRIAANLFRTLPDEEKKTIGLKLLYSVLAANPFNPEIWYRLALYTFDPLQEVALCNAALRSDPGLISDVPNATAIAKKGDGNANGQYWRTMAPYVFYYSLKYHPAPTGEDDMQRVYSFARKTRRANPNASVALRTAK